MTRLQGATIEDFNRTIEKLRGVYPFEDKYTEIVNTMDYTADAHAILTIHTVELLKDGDVHVVLQTEVKHEDNV